MTKRIFTIVAFLWAATAWSQNLVTIQSIQQLPMDSLLKNRTLSMKEGDTVRVRGVVTFDPRLSALGATSAIPWYQTFIEDTASVGNWKGLNVRMFPAADTNNVLFFDNFVKGNIIECTGVIGEFKGTNPISGETQINLLPVASQVVGFSTKPITAKVIQLSDLMRNNSGTNVFQPTTGEQYEGMYVEIKNVLVASLSVSTSTQRIAWRIQDLAGNAMQVRDNSKEMRPPFISSPQSAVPNPTAPVFIQLNKVYSYVRGVIVELITNGVSEYAIAPLTTTDIGAVLASPPLVDSVTTNPVVPTSSQAVTITADITDLDGSVQNAFVGYSVGVGNTNFTMLPMTAGLNNKYTAIIPAQANGSYVNFYVKGTDNQGNTTFFPDSLASRSAYRVLDQGVNSIKLIQETYFANGNSIYTGKVVPMNVRGIIMASVDTKDLGRVILQDGNGPWSGIMVSPGINNDLSNRYRGDSIRITQAKVVETNGVTTLEDVFATYISSGNPLKTAAKINLDSIAARSFTYCEPYESMLLKFDTVYVVNQNPDAPSNFGEFGVHYTLGSPTSLRVDDFATSMNTPPNFNLDSVKLNQKINFIYGILTYSFGNWKILPRNKSDIAGYYTPLGVKVHEIENPLTALGVYPNPAKDETNIRFNLSKSQNLNVEIYDINGRLMNRFVKSLNDGVHQLTLNTSNYANGLYFVKMTSEVGMSTTKLVVSK